MTTHFYYKLALSIYEAQEMPYLNYNERLNALYAMLAHATEAEEKENVRLKEIYGPQYKFVYSQWPDKIDDLITRFRQVYQEDLDREDKEFMERDYEDAQAKVYH